jgi:hypothetical protein
VLELLEFIAWQRQWVRLFGQGVDPTVARRVSGHLTDSTFQRYNITDEEEIRLAMRRTALYVSNLPTERKVVSLADAGDRNIRTTFAQPAKVQESDATGSTTYTPDLAEAGGNRTHTRLYTPSAPVHSVQ